MHVVITGSTRGIGFHMSLEFLKAGHHVTVTGTTTATLDSALSSLAELYPAERFQGVLLDAGDQHSIENLWQEAVSQFGSVDIWINNAGINQPAHPAVEVAPDIIQKVMQTNILGVIFGTRAAYNGMCRQGLGQIWNMEGLGSDGMMIPNTIIYGTSKRAVRYFTQGFSKETAGGPVMTGTLSPGMVLTDFLLNDMRKDEKARKNEKMFDILADGPETVAAFLVKGMLANKKHGAHIAWLTGGKIMLRFLASLFYKRNLVQKYL